MLITIIIIVWLVLAIFTYLIVRGGTMNKSKKEREDEWAEETKWLKDIEEKRKNRENKKARKKNI